MADFYHTIANVTHGDYRERGSKFLATAIPCSSEEELKSFIQELKKDHPSARHFCYGSVFGTEASEQRANDDGEPSGTAGLPIMNQILSSELTNTAVVIVRYFGGTKLGKSGLIHAYKEATKLALDDVKKKKIWIVEKVSIRFEYDDTGNIMRAIEQFPMAKIIEQNFLQSCELIVTVPQSAVDNALHLFDHLQHVSVKHIL
ncbi:YigZ family protein [bacterium]|nr:YigZ family protein [bacterium]